MSGGGGLAWAAANAPGGNNGTVKIDEYTVDPGQDNDPHVSCGFSVSFYGYDGGPQSASISVTPVAPTASGAPYRTSATWNVGTRTSGSQYDTSVQVSGADMAASLSGVSPQPQQGYHLRLEVEVTGSQGSDDKYKTFWMAPCSQPSAPAPAAPAPTTTSTTAVASTPVITAAPTPAARLEAPVAVTTTSVATTTMASPTLAAGHSKASARAVTGSASATPEAATAATRSGTPAVAAAGDTPAQATAGSVSGAVPVAANASVPHSSSSLAFTGADIAGMVIGGLTLIGVGGTAVVATRRRRTADQG